MPVVARYKGYNVHRVREPNYKVLDGKEAFEVVDEAAGQAVFSFTVYYNPRARPLLTMLDKEAVLERMLAPALEMIKGKIDAKDLTDGMLHVGIKPGARAVIPSGDTP